jgi:hypothetical protein
MYQSNPTMARLSLLLVAAVLAGQLPAMVICQASAQEAKRESPIELEEGFVWLFDGKSLDGWEGNQDWFRIEEGSIVAGSLAKEIPHNDFLGTTKQYGNFELKLEARLKGTGDNAGVQFRSSRVPDSTEVSGYQCDIGSAWGRPVWGGLYDESRRNKMLAEGDPKVVMSALKAGEWNELMVRAVDRNIQIWLNGSLTIDYTEVDSGIAKRGIIALQIHSGPPTEAWYRNIRIRELPTLR